MTDKELYKIKQRADEANDIINALHIERLDYRSEYIPLIESNQDILSLADEIERLQAENHRLKEVIDNQCDGCACEIANERDKLKDENARLRKENEGLRANSMIQEKIIEQGSNPIDKDKIITLTMKKAELQSEIDRLKAERIKHLNYIGGYAEKLEEMRDGVVRLKAERDKAVEDAEKGRVCYTCIHYDKDCSPLNPDKGCSSWKWRGLEESK